MPTTNTVNIATLRIIFSGNIFMSNVKYRYAAPSILLFAISAAIVNGAVT